MKIPLNIEIFIIDDDENLTDILTVILQHNGITNFKTFNDPGKMLAALNDNVHICVVDYVLGPGINGLDLIKKIVKRNPHCWVIMLSGQDHNEVIIDFLNSVNGSRYIAKIGKVDMGVALIKYIREITEHINFIASFYQNAEKINEGFSDLKKLLT